MHENFERESTEPYNSFTEALKQLTDQKSHESIEINKHNAAVLLYELSCNPGFDEIADKIQTILIAENDSVRWDVLAATVDAQTDNPHVSQKAFLDGLSALIEGLGTYSISQNINAIRVAYSIEEDWDKLEEPVARLRANLTQRLLNDGPGRTLIPILEETEIFYQKMDAYISKTTAPATIPDTEDAPDSSSRSPEQAPETLKHDFASALTYILEKGASWDNYIGDLGEVYVTQLLYEFSRSLEPAKAAALLQTVEETEDQTLKEKINTIVAAGEREELYDSFLEGFGSIITDTNTEDFTRNIRALHTASLTKIWDLSHAVETLRKTAENQPNEVKRTLVRAINSFYAFKEADGEFTLNPEKAPLPHTANSTGTVPAAFQKVINEIDLDDFTGKEEPKQPNLDIKTIINSLDKLNVDDFDSDVKE